MVFPIENCEKIIEKKKSNHEQFDDATGPIRGMVIYDKLSHDFMLLNILKNIQENLPRAYYDLYM